jgi:hypothetical protein
VTNLVFTFFKPEGRRRIMFDNAANLLAIND